MARVFSLTGFLLLVVFLSLNRHPSPLRSMLPLELAPVEAVRPHLGWIAPRLMLAIAAGLPYACRPLPVSIAPHRLQSGQTVLRWSEVKWASFGAMGCRVETSDGRVYLLG